MKNKKRWMIIGSISIVILSVAIFFLTNKKKVEKVYSSYTVTPTEDLHFSGTVKAKKVQNVFYDATQGEITSLAVQNGADVKAGDTLVNYSSKADQLALNEKTAVQSQYTTNIANLTKELQEKKYAYNQAVNASDDAKKQAAETAINTIETSITQYQDQLTDVNAQIASLNSKKESAIVAEFDGKIVVDEVAKKDATKPVVTVHSNDNIIEFAATEYDIEKIGLDQEVNISLMNQEKKIPGKVTYKSAIPKQEEKLSASYTGEVTPNETIPLGYSVKISIPQNEIKLPADTVVMKDQNSYVYIYKNGKANKQKVSVEKVDQDTYRLKEGAVNKDKLLRKSSSLKDKMDVKIK
ncbi:efflux RND transporter periplasmic adaptor subunit [Enterococcus caccae]|uniref:YknX-like barrel-sandwich hybrid domain-containing protein n=1 Tax=Enterococcus caccae ATCC BAA-1240 TaxID=1158612 RepID=R3TTS2_9ENTE|nr:efflux RND transporter periplasmic adaptor subunit [Enterococcus caccae]EOL44563.1 hypothetical protein UC7_02106 [Enterococcus caccae ATCC BAA-1240]EOT58706.1 hypothetical protein I580_02878 [Enterococcus caccae ATCC BAA-1240]